MIQPTNKVLIVDDESDVREILKMTIEMENIECITASSSVEGLERAAKENPNLILLDLLMPEMSGYGFLRERNKIPELSEIPVVVLTSLGDEEIAKEAMNLGAVGYLVKTSTKNELISMIREYART